MSTALTSPHHPRGIAKVGFSTQLPPDYYVQYRHGSYGAYLDGYGLIEDGYDCEAEAGHRCHDHYAVECAEQAEAKEAADEAAADTHAKLAQAVADFLWAADRGRFGEALRCDGADSAYVTDLRDKLAAVQATVALAQQVAA